jgi:hypothetical protein
MGGRNTPQPFSWWLLADRGTGTGSVRVGFVVGRVGTGTGSVRVGFVVGGVGTGIGSVHMGFVVGSRLLLLHCYIDTSGRWTVGMLETNFHETRDLDSWHIRDGTCTRHVI